MSAIKEYRIYKPNKAGNGAASKFQCRTKVKNDRPELVLFLETAKQKGVDEKNNARFAWAKKDEVSESVTVKLGLADIGEMLLVLSGRKQYVGGEPKAGRKVEPGLYHENKSGNTSIRLKWDKKTLFLNLSSQNAKTKDLIKVGHSITTGEAAILELLLADFVKQYHQWGLEIL
jgi:hypothetical protein